MLSKQEKIKLLQCHEKIQIVIFELYFKCNFFILETYRDEETQRKLFNLGIVKDRFSKHNFRPSRAIALLPYKITENRLKIQTTRESFLELYNIIKAIGDRHHIRMTWLGKYDSCPTSWIHFELIM